MAAVAVRLARLQGDPGSAKRALRKLGIDADQGLRHTSSVEQADERLILARIWLVEERYQEALALLEPVLEDARQCKHLRMVFVIQILQAMALLYYLPTLKRKWAISPS